MTTTETTHAEGLIEFLQATAPSWATKLTMERMGLIRQITQACAQRDYLLEALKDREDIEDGSEGPRPNEAMQILGDYERKFGERVERSEAAKEEHERDQEYMRDLTDPDQLRSDVAR